MHIDHDSVRFSLWDMPFVAKVGLPTAIDMVLDYRSTHATPFIYDTHQLSMLLFGPSEKQFLQVIRRLPDLYYTVDIPKRNGGTRQLSVPDALLKGIQKRICQEILAYLPISEHATAYRKGSTLYRNAAPHVGKRYLLKMDIIDFFGNITFEQIMRTVFHSGNYPRRIGTILTYLCCYHDVLPQGAPTSPMLSNLVMKAFDDALGHYCRQRGVCYTRYCDDLTFSGDESLYPIYQRARTMLEDMGFSVNRRKTHFITNASRQCVTGLVVNEQVSIPSTYKRQLRQEVYYALRFGLQDSILREKRADYIDNGVALCDKYYQHLLGRISYVLQIEPQNRHFLALFDALTEAHKSIFAL